MKVHLELHQEYQQHMNVHLSVNITRTNTYIKTVGCIILNGLRLSFSY